MIRYVGARLLHAVGIVFLVATITFVLLQLAPGDPLTRVAESTFISRDVIEQQRRNFGLDRPVVVQYGLYLGNLIRGDLGYSFREHRPAWHAIRDRVGNTVLLAAAGLTIMFALGIAAGAWQGAHPGSRGDTAVSLLTLTIYSTPVFWLGVVFVLVFAEGLQWLPATGATDPVTYGQLSPLGRAWDRLTHLALPALTLGLAGAATTARFQRAAMLDVIAQDYIRTARAKGLPERAVLVRHALRTALLPTVTLFGLAFPLLLSGTVLVETVFAWPGMGKLTVDAIEARDYAVVTGTAILAAILVVVGNLVADVLYRLLDPRTRETPVA
jgi:peptide/nickel transport system permease protein